MTCKDCKFFELNAGAHFVGECKAEGEINHIETINHKSDLCSKFVLIEKDKKEK